MPAPAFPSGSLEFPVQPPLPSSGSEGGQRSWGCSSVSAPGRGTKGAPGFNPGHFHMLRGTWPGQAEPEQGSGEPGQGGP